MYIVQKDMRDLKEKASVERIKAKQEARLVNLERERDWFRREALELDQMNKDHKKVLAELKNNLETVTEDKGILSEELQKTKLLNRELQRELNFHKMQNEASNLKQNLDIKT